MRASTCEGEQFGHERSPLAREVTALDSPTSECLTHGLAGDGAGYRLDFSLISFAQKGDGRRWCGPTNFGRWRCGTASAIACSRRGRSAGGDFARADLFAGCAARCGDALGFSGVSGINTMAQKLVADSGFLSGY